MCGQSDVLFDRHAVSTILDRKVTGMTQDDRRPSRLSAILRQRCPNCFRGQVFTGPLAMNETCPVCGVRFEREQGYFFGAMYFSYALSIPIVGALTAILAFTVLRGWPVHWIILSAGLVFLLFVPLVFRYSRILWMHLDRFFHKD